jgi:hypothetical protein
MITLPNDKLTSERMLGKTFRLLMPSLKRGSTVCNPFINAIFSSLGFGANVAGSRKFKVDTAMEEKNECDAIVSEERRVVGEAVTRDVMRPNKLACGCHKWRMSR